MYQRVRKQYEKVLLRLILCESIIFFDVSGSPLLQRRPRIRESSDEDNTSITPSSSDPQQNGASPPPLVDAMQCVHQPTTTGTTGQSTDHTLRSYTCKSCGGCDPTPTAQYIPVPVPIPVPFPVPWGGQTPFPSLLPVYKSFSPNATPGDFWQYFAQLQGFPWSLFDKSMIDAKVSDDCQNGAGQVPQEELQMVDDEPKGHLECENR